MSVDILLNLLNNSRNRYQMRGLSSSFEHFIALSQLNKFNNTGAQMYDCIHHMTLKILFKSTLKRHNSNYKPEHSDLGL